MDIGTLDSLRVVLDPIGQAGVALALMIVMFSVALGLRVDDFAFLRDKPLLFAGGVVSQVVVLPLVTFLLILAMEPPASIHTTESVEVFWQIIPNFKNWESGK